jgi:hypothetical protein
LTHTVIAEAKTTGEVCLDGENNAHQPPKTDTGARTGGTQSTLPIRIGFNIPMQAPNGYSVGQNSQIIWGMSGKQNEAGAEKSR